MLIQYKFILWMFGQIFLIWLLFGSRFFAFMDKDKQTQSRVEHLDGLRFFLAFMVALFHYLLCYSYFHVQQWATEINDIAYPVLRNIGGLGVATFFMISGYLFSTVNPTSWLQFYQKRFCRIAPIFYLSSICCIIFAFWIQKNNINTNHLFINLYYWLDAGITGNKPPLFGLDNSHLLNAGVTWTLFWEWGLYFSLPVMCILRDKIGVISLSIAVLFICVYIVSPFNYNAAVYISYFAIGALARKLPEKIQIPKYICNIGIILTILFMLLAADGIYNIAYLPVMALLFIFITMGGDVFGLLRQKGFVRLGDASYSIYLLHGLAWYGMNKYIAVHNLVLNRTQYTLVSTAVMFVLLVICTLTYQYIEKPFMALGRRKSPWLKE
ncbi:MAG: acyltransferase [Snodgrassella sp.]|uniref:acyltransferase family protein n=1 Tax=Snodgrassella sp. TaxID=2815304 RepID=UPI0025869464|nr:acyltransferase [Snodgrassella sp.]MCO6522010.1 acyltransferase [Snodgrassella sp.]